MHAQWWDFSMIMIGKFTFTFLHTLCRERVVIIMNLLLSFQREIFCPQDPKRGLKTLYLFKLFNVYLFKFEKQGSRCKLSLYNERFDIRAMKIGSVVEAAYERKEMFLTPLLFGLNLLTDLNELCTKSCELVSYCALWNSNLKMFPQNVFKKLWVTV